MTADPSTSGNEGTARTPRRLLRFFLRAMAVFLALLMSAVGIVYLQARASLGEAPGGERLARMMGSPQWEGGEFRNPQPLDDQFLRTFSELAGASEHVTPSAPIPVQAVDPGLFGSGPGSGLRVTWLGHSTILLEIDGAVILTDPVWGERASPLSWMGPKRWYAPPVALEDLPPVDAVVISHDHYDHLDHPAITAMLEWDTEFVVPLGVGAHLERWGVDPDRIVEMDWWDRHSVAGLEVVMTPARHASGRHMFDGNRTLWAGDAFLGGQHRAFFSGDTGMFPGIRGIGDRLGPFDLTMIEIGTYAQSWADWHMGPEQAIEAHAILGGRTFLPIHWGLFNLSTHGWTEPMERAVAAARARGVTLLAPRPGESIEVGKGPEVPAPSVRVSGGATVRKWWPDLPWRTAEEYPLISSHLGGS